MTVSGADIVQTAAKEMGDPYVFGAEGPNAFDCSGLVEYVFRKYGIKTPRTAAQQQGFGTAVQRSQIQPGDLIFFNWHGGNTAGHVGIYAGNGEMIHAPHTGTVVKKVKLTSYHWANEVAIRRFPGVTGGPATSESVLDRVGAALGGLPGVPNPSTVTGALSGIAGGISSLASSALSIGKVAEGITKLFLPSSLVRAAAALMGSAFLLLGIFFLSREVRD